MEDLYYEVKPFVLMAGSAYLLLNNQAGSLGLFFGGIGAILGLYFFYNRLEYRMKY